MGGAYSVGGPAVSPPAEAGRWGRVYLHQWACPTCTRWACSKKCTKTLQLLQAILHLGAEVGSSTSTPPSHSTHWPMPSDTNECWQDGWVHWLQPTPGEGHHPQRAHYRGDTTVYHSVQYTLYYTLYTVQYTLHTVYYTLYTVYHSVQYTLYTV